MVKVRNYFINVAWGVVLLMLSYSLYAETISAPNPKDVDWQSWALMMILGVAFSVGMYVVKRFMRSLDELAKSVHALAVQSAKSREWRKGVDKGLNILEKRANQITDWRNKHDKLHAACTECPPEL